MALRAAVALSRPVPRDPDTFILPHSLEAEKSTLGAALISATAADYIADNLTEEAYFRRAHRALFRAIREIRERKSEVDFVTLKQSLIGAGQLEEVGGPAYIASLADGLPRSVNVEHYAGILKDLHTRRVLAGYANQTLDLIASGAHSGDAILIDADRRLLELQKGSSAGNMQALGSSATALSADLEWRVGHKGELTGLETGYDSINRETLGWQAGDMIIVAARPSIGKTSFVLNSAVHAARTFRRSGERVRIAVFSLEMKRRQLEYRILAQLSGVQLTRILGGYIGDADYPKLSAAICEMGDLQIEIDDTSGQTVFDVRAACRRLKADGGLDGAVIDYIQLMPGSLEKRGATRNEELTDISRKLKIMAGELGLPVLVLSQLNRGSEDRLDTRPKLRDLRESGALEQDADIVAFLHRKNHREGGPTEFILEKQRNGATGTVMLTLDRETTTFTDGGEALPPEPERAKTTRVRPPRLFAGHGR